jgi:hypothetical protein
MLTDAQQRNAAKKFVETWKNKGYEKGETQVFWINLLRTVLGVRDAETYISFENKVSLNNTSFMDAYISETKVLIEQKSLNIDLTKPQKQSDGSMLTPFEQAKRYSNELGLSKKPRYIVVCNFKEFHVHDMEYPQSEPEIIKLENLPKEYYRLSFLADTHKVHLKREMELSFKAGEIIGRIYDEILTHYNDKTAENTLKSLNMLCVRLVFCLYAEDSGIFEKDQFHDYLSQFEAKQLRNALINLFKALDTKEEDRDPYLENDLAAFPYVNGGLFAETNIEIPQFDDAIKELLLTKASDDFNWSEISPTIFGALFESTLNPETRRSGGMHYTSIENIHKVIDPLFLDDLEEELDKILSLKTITTRNKKIFEFQDKLASLTFLDPACGSGNFLTETYISLRQLENKCLEVLGEGQTFLGFDDIIKVGINQFYGIEINDFAVTVAKTALWIAESQMMKATEDIVHMELNFLPLKSYANIVEANALRIDWNTVIPKEKLHYIMGNPPFVGQSVRAKEQVDDMTAIFGKGSVETKLDYVLCWYYKAIQYMEKTSILTAYVSTNSICQGESVPTFWKRMVEHHAEIQFAHQTFRWNSEARDMAAVHCVIVGFSAGTLNKKKLLYTGNKLISTDHINSYLLNAPDIWLENRTNVGRNNQKMTTGSPPTDDGGLLLTAAERAEFLKKYPQAEKFIRPFIGAREFLHDKSSEFSRYCFWFKDVSPMEYCDIKELNERFEKVRNIRLKSNADRIQKMATSPHLFCQIRQPENNYLVIPRHSSERRNYIPIGFVSPDVVAGDACTIVLNADLFLFAMLTSSVHMAWMRVVCGRIKSDFRYSPSVYNNFPFPEVSEAQKNAIEKAGQKIFDARLKYPDATLADLYGDKMFAFSELQQAHIENDNLVKQAYGYSKNISEYEIVADLMKLYQELTAQ